MRRLTAGYSEKPVPFGSYALLVVAFNALVVAFLRYARREGRLPERISVADIALLGVATHKLSRLITKDRVTSMLRAPFVEFVDDAGGPEVSERPRGTGMRRALGELLT